MNENLEQKALSVVKRLKNTIHPSDSELLDAVYDAIVNEFNDWESIVCEQDDAELSIGPVEQAFRSQRKQEQ